MAFTELELKAIDGVVGDYCRRKSQPRFADQLRYACDIKGHAVSIFEERVPWDGRGGAWTRMGVARFRYVRSEKAWKLYWMRADLRWHLYEPDPGEMPTDLEALLRLVEEDRLGAFFG